MEIQIDREDIADLVRQLIRRAGPIRPDLGLRMGKSGLALYQQNNLVTTFTGPIKPGAILNFITRMTARPAIESLPESLAIGPYVFWPKQSTLKGGQDIILTDKERDILGALWLAPGKALSREALLQAVWAYAAGVETHTLETHIYRLRQKMENDPTDPQWLINEEGLYKLQT